MDQKLKVAMLDANSDYDDQISRCQCRQCNWVGRVKELLPPMEKK